MSDEEFIQIKIIITNMYGFYSIRILAEKRSKKKAKRGKTKALGCIEQ